MPATGGASVRDQEALDGARLLLMRRKEKVATEMSLTVLAYNLKRVLNLVGTQKLIAALA